MQYRLQILFYSIDLFTMLIKLDKPIYSINAVRKTSLIRGTEVLGFKLTKSLLRLAI